MRDEPGPFVDVFDPVMPDIKIATVLSDLYKAGAEGRDARTLKSEGYCNALFHQTCLDRRPEASQDRRYTTSMTIQDETVVQKKDIRHRCCDPCLLEVTGTKETAYTGKLDGMSGLPCFQGIFEVHIAGRYSKRDLALQT